MFAIFQIAASFLPDDVYFGKKDVIRAMIRPCQHEEIRSVQWYEVYPELVKLFLSKTLFVSVFVSRSSNQM